jgi:hypothetical protein
VLWKAKVKRFNNKTALVICTITGSMLFFWPVFLIIVFIRSLGSPEANGQLTAVENDLQVLLIAANAVVGAMQLGLTMKLLKRILADDDKICAELGGKVAKLGGG